MERAASYDVLIAGAGPAGSATAIALARRGLRVLLLERSRFEHGRIGESLAPSVQPLLRELGVWEQFRSVPQVASFGGVSVWGDDEPQAQSYMAQRFSCGFHVERKAFDHMLAEAAHASGADLQLGTALERCQLTPSGYRVSVRCGRERSALDTRVLIDATGRRAHVSRQLGAQRLLFDRAVAIAARLHVLTESHLLVEAAAPGWFYSAPLSDDTLSVMWMTDADLCRDVQLRAAIAQAPYTHARVQASDVYPGGPIQVHCAHSQRMSHAPWQLAAAGPYLAVGDAALAVDPIAGDGVVRALRSARRAAATVLQLLEAPQAQHELLTAYAAESDAECTRYLEKRVHYYVAEQRFDTPYWQRRALAAHEEAGASIPR